MSDRLPPSAGRLSGFLPATPDLVATESRADGPVVRHVSPWLAAWLGCEARELFGRRVSEALDPQIPGLSALVARALGADGPVVLGQPRRRTVGPRSIASLIAAPVTGRSGEKAVEVQIVEESDETGLRATHAFSGMIGHGPAMRDLFLRIERYASSSAPVLVTGETGTGKELAARALHQRSPRHREAFVAVNCAALSSDLVESELFGHEKGAFTGAATAHRGRFERADRGTLFLDEIGEMPRKSQTKLLRVLEEGTVERVGAERARPIDVRVVAATNVSLEQAVAQRRFREDLYYRLSVLRLHLAPLRDRLQDIPLLATYFLSVFAHHYERGVLRLTPRAVQLLGAYRWPGNVRELKNVLERIVVETAGEVIGERAFAEWVREREHVAPGAWDIGAGARRAPPLITPPLPSARASLGAPTIDATFSDVIDPPPALTRRAVLDALASAGGNVTRAARILGFHKATLYRHLRAWGISRREFPTGSSDLKR